ncbi:hypothetical protein GCM10020220_040280 [Nonomuraea rubra]|uniref:AAA family ATPase n=1 Tax=Nonomuraea rubra TaxID=46180 RepID=UPI0031ED97D4
MNEHVQRPPAEIRYAGELARLREDDTDPRPPGWALSLRAARRFVLGDEKLGISRKFVGDPSLIDRSLVSLATNRGLMLVGEPGTAKSLLSELLAAAVSGTSTLTIQGGAATTEDQIKYSWNYALLVAEGPSTRSLVAAPLLRGMAEGKVVRFEEITNGDRRPTMLWSLIVKTPVVPNRIMTEQRRSPRSRSRGHLLAHRNIGESTFGPASFTGEGTDRLHLPHAIGSDRRRALCK